MGDESNMAAVTAMLARLWVDAVDPFMVDYVSCSTSYYLLMGRRFCEISKVRDEILHFNGRKLDGLAFVCCLADAII